MTTLPNLENEAKKITLSLRERELMRARIFGEPAAVPRYTPSYVHFFSVRFAPVLAAVLIIVLGSGTAYAAQAAVPGDLLYAVKVNVNEPVRQVLAVGPEAKANFHSSVVQDRLEEAEELAAQGKLNADITAQIEESLNTHLARAEELAEELAEADTDVALGITDEIDSSLSAHGVILAKLGEESEDEETKERSNVLAERITSRVFARVSKSGGIALNTAPAMKTMALMTIETAEDVSVSSTTNDSQQADEPQSDEAAMRAAVTLQKKVTDNVRTVRNIFENITDSLDATTSARVEAQLNAFDDQMTEGSRLIEAGEYVQARATFNSVMRDSIELRAYLEAEKRFNKKFLRIWVDTRFGSWSDPNDSHEEVHGMEIDSHSGEHDEDGQDEEGQETNDLSDDSEDGGDDGHSGSIRGRVDIDLGL